MVAERGGDLVLGARGRDSGLSVPPYILRARGFADTIEAVEVSKRDLATRP